MSGVLQARDLRGTSLQVSVRPEDVVVDAVMEIPAREVQLCSRNLSTRPLENFVIHRRKGVAAAMLSNDIWGLGFGSRSLVQTRR